MWHMAFNSVPYRPLEVMKSSLNSLVKSKPEVERHDALKQALRLQFDATSTLLFVCLMLSKYICKKIHLFALSA